MPGSIVYVCSATIPNIQAVININELAKLKDVSIKKYFLEVVVTSEDFMHGEQGHRAFRLWPRDMMDGGICFWARQFF
ncbi:uncharacterized protein RAG0_08411 [Rhynchosporium agropyri]|uniref:Uncharacterized protein n=1 Tax=Rhynchosporium agropyri TaxID=914238 RepID=A0A1E1KTQ4_9HELO|nr:uncharacterized protein RAG0_08411 [Rhynchosporium agropyri]